MLKPPRLNLAVCSNACDSHLSRLSLENQQLREKVEILEYLLGRSETDGDTHTTPSSAPSGEQVSPLICLLIIIQLTTICWQVVPALGRGTVVSFASQRSLSSSVLPLSTTGKLLGARLPPLSTHGFDAAALLEEDGHVDLGIGTSALCL